MPSWTFWLDLYTVTFFRDGKSIVSGSIDRTLRIWDAQLGRLIHVVKCTQGFMAFSPDGKIIISAGDDVNVCIWDTHRGAVHSLRCST